MLLSNKPLLFLIAIAFNKFVEGEKIFEKKLEPVPKSDRKCKKVCDKYLNDKPTVINSKVFGDVNRASSTNFPHNCILRDKHYYNDLRCDGSLIRDENYDNGVRCGGSLISDQWVLTAAHCKVNKATEVVLGTDNILANDSTLVSIKERFVHPNYNANSKHNDITLIKLEESVQFSSKIYPACLFLDNKEPAEGTDLIVTGFGKNSVIKRGNIRRFRPIQEKSLSDLLNMKRKNLEQSDLLIQKKHKICPTNLRYRYTARSRFGIITSQICANGITYGVCDGDGGGPLQFLLNEEKQISSVVGIVSFRSSFGCRRGITIFTKVSWYLDWIEEHVWPEDVQI